MRITLLGRGHHLHAARRIDGYSSCVHRAEMKDEHGKPFTAYVKAFPTDSKALANEIAGWLLSRALNLPAAPRAYVCLVTIGKLRNLFPELRWPGADADVFPCWATEEMQHTPLTIISEADSIVWRDKVQGWPHLPAAIAFNHWLYNIDSNPGNLLYIQQHQFALIDYADILGGKYWNKKELKQLGYLHNKLLHLAWGGIPPPDVTAEIERTASKHGVAWQKAKAAIYDWWEDLLKSKDLDAAIGFIESRAEPSWIKGKIA